MIDQPMHKVHLAFADLSHALNNGNASYKWYRRVFLDACLQYIQLVGEDSALNSDVEEYPKAYLKLLEIREPFIEWILRDSIINEGDFSRVLIPFFGKLGSAAISYGDAHNVFTKDLFLYTVAALIQAESFSTIGSLFHSPYFIQDKYKSYHMYFPDFNCASTVVVDGPLLKENPTPLITFHELMQAELLCVFASCFWESKTCYPMTWYPRLLVHAEDHALFELFQRMESRSFYDRVKMVVPEMPTSMVEQGVGLTKLVCDRLRRITLSLDWFENMTWKPWMNLDKLGSVD